MHIASRAIAHCCAAVALAIAVPGRAETPPWSVQDLGGFGGNLTRPFGLNDAGLVVGYSYLEGNRRGHAFLFDGGQLTDLGTFGGSNSVGWAINSFGDVAGYAHVPGDRTMKAFVYRGGRKVNLGTLGGPFSAAYGINDKGEVVGFSVIDSEFHYHAFLFRDGGMEDIGTLGGSLSLASDINNKGQVVGTSAIEDDSGFHGFLYRNGHMRDLGEFTPTSINDRSEIVGWASTPEGNRTFIFRAGKLHILGTLAGTDTYPTSINNCGEVVGESLVGSGVHGFVYSAGQFVDLNSVLPTSFGPHVLYTAAAINDVGQVAASGYDAKTGEWRGYLLTPPAASRCVHGRGNTKNSKSLCPCSTARR